MAVKVCELPLGRNIIVRSLACANPRLDTIATLNELTSIGKVFEMPFDVPHKSAFRDLLVAPLLGALGTLQLFRLGSMKLLKGLTVVEHVQHHSSVLGLLPCHNLHHTSVLATTANTPVFQLDANGSR